MAAGARTADLESGEVDSTGPGGLQGLSRWARGPAGSRRQGNKEDPYQAWDTMGSLVPEKSGTGTAPGNCSQRGKHGTQHINGTLSLGETTLLPYSLSLSPASLATGKYTTQTRDHMRGFHREEQKKQRCTCKGQGRLFTFCAFIVSWFLIYGSCHS